MPALISLTATRRRTGVLLLGKPNLAHAALADYLKQPIGTDDAAHRGPLRKGAGFECYLVVTGRASNRGSIFIIVP